MNTDMLGHACMYVYTSIRTFGLDAGIGFAHCYPVEALHELRRKKEALSKSASTPAILLFFE